MSPYYCDCGEELCSPRHRRRHSSGNFVDNLKKTKIEFWIFLSFEPFFVANTRYFPNPLVVKAN